MALQMAYRAINSKYFRFVTHGIAMWKRNDASYALKTLDSRLTGINNALLKPSSVGISGIKDIALKHVPLRWWGGTSAVLSSVFALVDNFVAPLGGLMANTPKDIRMGFIYGTLLYLGANRATQLWRVGQSKLLIEALLLNGKAAEVAALLAKHGNNITNFILYNRIKNQNEQVFQQLVQALKDQKQPAAGSAKPEGPKPVSEGPKESASKAETPKPKEEAKKTDVPKKAEPEADSKASEPVKSIEGVPQGTLTLMEINRVTTEADALLETELLAPLVCPNEQLKKAVNEANLLLSKTQTKMDRVKDALSNLKFGVDFISEDHKERDINEGSDIYQRYTTLIRLINSFYEEYSKALAKGEAAAALIAHALDPQTRVNALEEELVSVRSLIGTYIVSTQLTPRKMAWASEQFKKAKEALDLAKELLGEGHSDHAVPQIEAAESILMNLKKHKPDTMPELSSPNIPGDGPGLIFLQPGAPPFGFPQQMGLPDPGTTSKPEHSDLGATRINQPAAPQVQPHDTKVLGPEGASDELDGFEPDMTAPPKEAQKEKPAEEEPAIAALRQALIAQGLSGTQIEAAVAAVKLTPAPAASEPKEKMPWETPPAGEAEQSAPKKTGKDALANLKRGRKKPEGSGE